jgi:hypothetical protein
MKYPSVRKQIEEIFTNIHKSVPENGKILEE